MPNKDGFDASKDILQIQNELKQGILKRAKKPLQKNQFFENQDCEIVALTAFNDSNTYEKCNRVGIKEVINKPISVHELLRVILVYHFKLD